jgi:hypothetical protein
MRRLRRPLALAGLAAAGALAAGETRAEALALPAMGPTLEANPDPVTFGLGALGQIAIGGVASGLGLAQSKAAPGDRSARLDLSNALVIVQKSQGVVQFYAQLGAYAFPAVGAPYYSARYTTANTYGAAPEAFVKWAPSAAFSVRAGKVPAIIGMESELTFQNSSIERGLLWTQEPTVSQAVQLTYAKGPWALWASLDDGFYSQRFNWVSGQVVYTFSARDSVTLNGGASLGANARSDFATPLAQNNESIIVAGFNHAQGPLAITPYVQYSHVEARPGVGLRNAAATLGAAVLGKYSLAQGFSLGGRLEYLASFGGDPADPRATNLLYGARSRAWSVTLTPTYQVRRVFIRGEVSYTGIAGAVPGLGFGRAGQASDQVRALVETGVIF